MIVARRITATVLATVATVLGLLAAAAAAAASPVDPNDGNGFPTSLPQAPTGAPNTTIVNSGSPGGPRPRRRRRIAAGDTCVTGR